MALHGGPGPASSGADRATERASSKQRSDARPSAKAEREHGTMAEPRRRENSRDGAARPATTSQMVLVRIHSNVKCPAFLYAAVPISCTAVAQLHVSRRKYASGDIYVPLAMRFTILR